MTVDIVYRIGRLGVIAAMTWSHTAGHQRCALLEGQYTGSRVTLFIV